MNELRLAAHALDVGASGFDEYRRLVAQALKQHFFCSTASVWCVSGRRGERALSCVGALSDSPRSIVGITIDEHHVGSANVDALTQDGLYSCPDVLADPHFAGLWESYFIPQNIRGLLYAAFQVNARRMGLLSLSQMGEPRRWTRAEESDLRNAATAVSLAFTRHWVEADRNYSA